MSVPLGLSIRIATGTLHWAGVLLLLGALPGAAEIIDKQQALDAQTFWDNQDTGWFKANIPFFVTL